MEKFFNFDAPIKDFTKKKKDRLKFVIGEDYVGTREERLLDILSAIGFYTEINTDMYDYLIEEEFCIVPASTKYHGNYEGGLFDHSLEVTRALYELTEKLDLQWRRYTSPIIIGMFHDLCKIDAYIPYTVDQHNNITYTYNNDQILPGHGEKSIILLQEFANLTEEEILCIRWHMGAFDDKDNWNYYSRAIEKYPNVLYAHTADMIASKIKGI